MKYRHFKLKLRAIASFLVMFVISATLTAQKTSISGIVKDARTGEVILGANIFEKGTSNGTITNFDGRFTLSVAANATLQVKYIGYTAILVPLAGKTNLVIELKEDIVALGEVVAIGYGSQTKKEITGSIASVKSEDFIHGVVSNPMGLVQGKVAGLTIIKNGGDDPAQNSYQVQLRGVGSLKGNAEPLYIIDGVPGGDLSSVLPSDIESIDVLKDGSAAAIYGTRANAGVILITTKRGKVGKSSIEYSGSASTGTIAKIPRILTADEYRQYMVSSDKGIDLGGNTNWLNQLTRTPFNQTHALSMAGGTELFNYRSSISFRSLQGVAKSSNYEELNGRFAANQKSLNKKLEISYDFSYTSSNRNWTDYDIFNQAIRVNPTQPIYFDQTNPDYEKYNGYYETNAFYSYNPVSRLDNTINDQKNKVFLGSVRAALSLSDNIKFTTFYSIQQQGVWNGKYENRFLKSVVGKNGVATQSQANNQTEVVENTLQYINSFGKSNLSAFIGQSYQYSTYQSFNAFNSNFPIDKTSYNNLGMGIGIKSGIDAQANVGSSLYTDKLASFFARGLYSFNDKYYFNASVRMEGSSKFGPKADPVLGRWGIFPAVSASWRMKGEEFLSDLAWLNDLKLRAGYGVTGNMPTDSYLYAMRVGQTGEPVFIDGAFVKPWGAQSNINESIRWEKKHEYNIGVDFSILNNRITGSIDTYLRKTVDLLWDYKVLKPPYVYDIKWDNYGQLSNWGIELSLNGVIIKQKDFTWNAGLVAAINRNKVLVITGGEYASTNPDFLDVGSITSGDGETGTNVMRLKEGQPIGNFWGFKYAGINDKAEWVFETPAGGFTTTPTNEDRQIIGNAQPFMTFGLNTALTYKQFDLAFNFRGQIGGTIFNEMRYFYENTRGAENVLLSAFEGDALKLTKWKKDVLSASIRRFSDFYLEDATFIKLTDVSIGYNFKPSENIRKYINSVRLNVTGQNLLTISGYKGMDPEVSMNGLAPGFDSRSYYPKQRTFLVGVSATF
jgi:TonB-linked SusC/RagA family outer membrane protein